jgi:hypothetical protein
MMAKAKLKIEFYYVIGGQKCTTISPTIYKNVNNAKLEGQIPKHPLNCYHPTHNVQSLSSVFTAIFLDSSKSPEMRKRLFSPCPTLLPNMWN